MHKSTALIIITIILYISFKINIRFPRENSRGAVLTKKNRSESTRKRKLRKSGENFFLQKVFACKNIRFMVKYTGIRKIVFSVLRIVRQTKKRQGRSEI